MDIVVSCPIDTYSGYGARSRDLVKCLNINESYNVKVLPQPWGNTRTGYLKDHDETGLLSQLIYKVDVKPDVFIQITVPNEFVNIGTYNIGVTAAMETDISPVKWVEGVNKMDLILTSSKHGKDSLLNSVYTIKNNNGTQSKLQVNTPIEVLFEGLDTTVYNKLEEFTDENLKNKLDSIEESFAFLVVGTWLPGKFGEDRKNIPWTIKLFLETFKNKRTMPALILKTQKSNPSIMDKYSLLKSIEKVRSKVKGKLPNIYLIHGDLKDYQMNEVYNHPKVKAMVSLTKGEGFGRPLLEFSAMSKPIVASNWSGHKDFLNLNFVSLIGGRLKNVDESATVKDLIIPEAKWFSPDEVEASKVLKDIYKNYKKYKRLAVRQAHYTLSNYNIEKMNDRLYSILENRIPNKPKEIKFNLED